MGTTTLNRHVHQLTADHTSYDRGMSKSATATKGLAKSNQSLVSAISLVDGPLGGVASRASNLKSIFSSGGVAIGAFAIGVSALGFGLAKTLTVMSSVETEMAKIDNLIRATGGSTGLLAEEFDGMARSVALDTLASINDIRQAIASLMTFRSVGSESFERTIRLSQDMAAVWGGSAATNARKLGKSLEDPIKQLSRLETTVGAFDSTSREAILTMAKAGDKAGAQAKILETLEKRIKGAGNALGLPGAKDTLAQRWEEFFETVGRTTGVSDFAAAKLNQLADSLNNISKALEPDTDEDKIAEKRYKMMQVLIGLADEREKLNVLTNKAKMGSVDDSEVAQQKSIIAARNNQLTILENEIKALEAKSAIKNEDLFLDKMIAQGSEKYFKIQQEGIEKQLRDKAELDEMQKWIDAGSILRFNAMGKQAEAQIKAEAKLREEFNKLRETGLTDIQKENELNQNNVTFLDDYKKKLGETSVVKKAIAAEEVRHIEKLNELNLDKDISLLSSRLGEASSDDLDVDSGDRENKQHILRMKQLIRFGAEETANAQAINKLKEDEQERHSDAMVKISEFEAKNKQKAQQEFWNNASSLMNSQSRKLFEIGKIAAISNAVVSATETIPHAYKWGTKIGGPVLGAAFAATALAATTTQIQAINNAQFGSKSVDSSGASTSSVTPISSATQESSKSVEIHLNGTFNGLSAEHLAETLKDYIDSTDFILVDRASRNGQEFI